jgi:UDP-glucose 4-epimerase
MSDSAPHSARRILITGLASYWGGRLAQALESFPEVDAIIGVDSREPRRELARTEYVKVDTQHALLQRIVQAAEIDTVIDTRLVVDSIAMSRSQAHENNVIGTMNILAACGGAESPVQKLVFKSSAHWYGCEQDDPAFFTEETSRRHPPRTATERDVIEAEAAVAEFAEKRPAVTVSILRCANVLGPDIDTSHIRMFSLPLVPMILGFDPRYQFAHEDDVVHSLEHATFNDLDGVYNVAGDGVLALSEVIGLLGKRPAPVLPPWGTGLVVGPLRRLGLPVPDEMLNQLRFGRGLDNRKLKSTGFAYQYTSREAVLKLGEHLRLSPVLAGISEPYRYEREVEEFLRWSPHVRREPIRGGGDEGLFATSPPIDEAAGSRRRAAERRAAARPPDDPSIPDPSRLEAEEVIAALVHLDAAGLDEVERRERSGPAREVVLEAIDGARSYQSS